MQSKTNETFRFAHLSDLHLSSPAGVRAGELMNKRLLGYLSWRLRRRAEHAPSILSALVQDLREMELHHIAITGDLTHIGLPTEFQQVREWLERLGSPPDITVIPGNHDTYVRAAWDRTFAVWAPYMTSDDGPRETGDRSRDRSTFPTVRLRGQAALIGLSTARPSAPFLAVGSVGRGQLERLEEILEQTGRQNLFRIVLLHHPPVHGVVGWRKRLTDGAALRSVLARHGAELVLHGHAHRASLTHSHGPRRRIPIIGIPSSSARGTKPGHRARYHVYEVRSTWEGWDVTISVRGYSSEADRFVAETRDVLGVCVS